MLETLKLRNIGPAPELELACHPRVNLVTGDNGLGKTFLLDTAWWSLTGHWARDVNPQLTVGFPAAPRDEEAPATIVARFRWAGRASNQTAKWLRPDERWARNYSGVESLIVYAHADGSVSVWDPLRNYPGGDDFSLQGSERYRFARRDGPAAYVFSEPEVWDGLWEEKQGRRTPICNGLLFDWSSWIKDQDRSNADSMQAALKALSPGGGDILSVGPVQRLSVRDARDIPTILTTWAGAVPILHAAAGVRRVCSLAYVLTWAWQEHGLVAARLGEPATGSVILLFDEVESHLHPRWQRTILGALRDIGNEVLDNAGLQLIVTTHSPLVMASAEAWFDPEQDAWFDLDLEGPPPRAPSCMNATTGPTAGRARGSPAKPSTWRPIAAASRRSKRLSGLGRCCVTPAQSCRKSWRRITRCAMRCLTWTSSGCAGTLSWNGTGASHDSRESGAGTIGLRPRGATAGFARHRGTGWGNAAASSGPSTRSDRRHPRSDPCRQFPILLARGPRRSPSSLRSRLRVPLCSHLDRRERRSLRCEVPALEPRLRVEQLSVGVRDNEQLQG